MSLFALCSLLGLAVVVTVAAAVRGRFYAMFVCVLLGIHTAVSVPLARYFQPLLPLYAFLQASVYVHYLLLARPRMRPLWYRALISIPASWFAAATFLAFPWAIVSGLGFTPHALWLPYLFAAAGILESFFAREELVDLVLDGQSIDGLRRHPLVRGQTTRPLRILQITDPHLGPFMSEARLRRICERAVARNPDIILLTGDFLTMESQTDPDLLGRALAPLRAFSGKAFACRGNHDHEAPAIVANGLASAGVQLLIDEAVTVETAAGRVQILGLDFHFRGRAEKIKQACTQYPRDGELPRIVMLHDPGAFVHLPPGEGDLVLSGHTHGGQLGLLRLGLPHTIVSALSRVPDHGLWARGRDRLYVHRGTGHYGFPVRLGVPSEQSLLQVHFARTNS